MSMLTGTIPRSSFKARRLSSSILLVLLLSGMAGCVGSQPALEDLGRLPEGFPNHDAQQIIAHLPPYPEAMRRVFAESQIALSSPEEKGRFSAKISYLHPESLFVRVTFPLGIEGARVLATPDTAWVYDRVKKVVWTGSPDRIAAVLPGAVAGTRLVELATGFDIPSPDVDWQVTTDSTLYLLSHPDGSVRYTIDPGIWRVVSVRLNDADHSLVEQRWYTDFVEVDGVVLPRRMALVRPPDSLRISMALRRIELDPDGPLTFELDPDPDAQIIDLGR